MAAAFTQIHAGEKVDVLSAGGEPADTVNPIMVAAMQEKGIDMAFRSPRSVETALAAGSPRWLVTLGLERIDPSLTGVERFDWVLSRPAADSIEAMRDVRDDLEKKVKELIDRIA
jgi:protein-tyrosine-phosphatase